jgi:hypothetical protein
MREQVAKEIDQTFEKALELEIKARLQEALARGLTVTLNQIPVGCETMKLLDKKELAPAYKRLVYPAPKEKTVTVKLYCGLGDSDPARAGWHIYCNGRLVLEADKGERTGWGENRETDIPAFHGQFNRFRGFAFFDCDDAGRLPWDTTKTGINSDSPIYRASLLEMMKLMRPVIDFLNRLKEEKEGRDEADSKGPLEKLVDTAPSRPFDKASTRQVFEMPHVRAEPKPSGPVLQRIQYDRPRDKVLSVMKKLGVRSYVKVGEGTFDYFFNAECEE